MLKTLQIRKFVGSESVSRCYAKVDTSTRTTQQFVKTSCDHFCATQFAPRMIPKNFKACASSMWPVGLSLCVRAPWHRGDARRPLWAPPPPTKVDSRSGRLVYRTPADVSPSDPSFCLKKAPGSALTCDVADHKGAVKARPAHHKLTQSFVKTRQNRMQRLGDSGETEVMPPACEPEESEQKRWPALEFRKLLRAW